MAKKQDNKTERKHTRRGNNEGSIFERKIVKNDRHISII